MDSVAVLDWLRLARAYRKVAHASTTRLRAFRLSLAQLDVLAQVGAAEEFSALARAEQKQLAPETP